MKDQQLSKNFRLSELIVHPSTPELSNDPTPGELSRLHKLASNLEIVRLILGNNPISINSAFRSPAVNERVGGVSNSAHRLAYAADLECPKFGSPLAVSRALAAQMKPGGQLHGIVDQLIYEVTWTHVSFDPTGSGSGHPRGELLTHPESGGYLSGIIG